MAKMLSTLKTLATCLGCCERTKDIPANNNAEAIEFICDNLHLQGGGITNITLDRDINGVVVAGTWTDAKGLHDITIY